MKANEDRLTRHEISVVACDLRRLTRFVEVTSLVEEGTIRGIDREPPGLEPFGTLVPKGFSRAVVVYEARR